MNWIPVLNMSCHSHQGSSRRGKIAFYLHQRAIVSSQPNWHKTWTMAVLSKSFCQAHETMYPVTWSRAGQRCDRICLEGESGQVDSGARGMPHHHLSTTWFSCIFKLSFEAKSTGLKWKPVPSISWYGHSIRFHAFLMLLYAIYCLITAPVSTRPKDSNTLT